MLGAGPARAATVAPGSPRLPYPADVTDTSHCTPEAAEIFRGFAAELKRRFLLEVAMVDERYSSRDAYLAAVEKVADGLVKGGYVLAEDKAQLMKRAEDEWEAAKSRER